MLPFTKEDVKAAYAATGLKPKAGGWISDDETAACPLTALCVERVGLDKVRELCRKYPKGVKGIDREMEYLAAETLHTDWDDIRSFWRGFDSNTDYIDDYASMAFRIGREYRKAILPDPENT